MDGSRFDDLTRLLGAARSRRSFFRAVIALASSAAGLKARESTEAAGDRICDAKTAHACVLDATVFHNEQVANCRALLRDNPEDPSHSAQLMFACLAGEKLAFQLALSACKLHKCDARNCEHCVSGTCQSICPAGVACVGGRCGCASDQHACGHGCCASDQACCNHACCGHGVTACGPGGSCACPAGEKLCRGSCIASEQCCVDADCPPNNACQNGACQPIGCAALGAACTADSACCAQSGVTCGTFGTCCLSANSFCSADSDCCGGHCDAVSGRCCAGAGQDCSVERDCCQLSNLTCGENGACCLPAGQQCNVNQDCCNGHCDQTSHTCCLANGSTCSVDADCCGGSCVNGTCCTSHLKSCGSDGDCCAATGDICPSGVCCKNAGGACSTISDCCFSGNCTNGTCCLADGLNCAQNSDCCNGTCGTDGTCGGCPSGLKQCPNLSGCWQCCVDSDCPSGQICHIEQCEAASPCGTCPGPAMGQPGCSCLADTGGASHCLGVGCWEDTPGTCRSCATNADCPQGFACWRNDLGDQICLPVCAPLS